MNPSIECDTFFGGSDKKMDLICRNKVDYLRRCRLGVNDNKLGICSGILKWWFRKMVYYYMVKYVAMPAMGCHASEETDEENTRRTDISDQKLWWRQNVLISPFCCSAVALLANSVFTSAGWDGGGLWSQNKNHNNKQSRDDGKGRYECEFLE